MKQNIYCIIHTYLYIQYVYHYDTGNKCAYLQLHNFLILYHCMQYIPLPYPSTNIPMLYMNTTCWATYEKSLTWMFRPFWGPDCLRNFGSLVAINCRCQHTSPLVLATINGQAQLHHDVAKCLQPRRQGGLVPRGVLRGKPKQKKNRKTPQFIFGHLNRDY